MPSTIVPIVEGYGEVPAVPILLRRVATEILGDPIEIRKPIRIPKHKLLKAGELERALDLAVQKGDGPCGILIILDADEDCPKEIAGQLLARARVARADATVQVVLAKMEYEAWFLGAVESLLAVGQELPDFELSNAETIRGAKQRLSEILGIFYSETVDQAAFTASIKLTSCRATCPSFDKLCRSLKILLDA